jgi:MFS family permease
MSLVEHEADWSKLADLLPQLGREYAKRAGLYRIFLTVVAILPPLLIPIEAFRWYEHNPAMLGLAFGIYAIIAIPLFLLTGRYVENLRSFAEERIAEEELLPRMLDRIVSDAGKSEQMVFEELYLNDGSGLEWRTRKHIVYAENDIELNMDRGQKLFGNNNVPLMINTGLVALFCVYSIVGGFYFANDESRSQGVIQGIQQGLLLALPVAIYTIQGYFRQHQLNFVVAGQLLSFIKGDESPAAQALTKVEDGAEDSLQVQT